VNNEPVALSVAIGGVLSTGVALIAVFVPDLDAPTQALIIAFGNSVILAGSILWARHQVYTQRSVQRIANAATFEAPGTVVDIGAPPEGDIR
jgi:hypothetical protein